MQGRANTGDGWAISTGLGPATLISLGNPLVSPVPYHAHFKLIVQKAECSAVFGNLY